MGQSIVMDEDRLFPSDPTQRRIARRLYGEVKGLPLISPHGHTDPRWYADDAPFPDPAALFLIPDHYLLRMLYSQGVSLEKLGIPRVDGGPVEPDPRAIWRLFAEHYHLFRGTPSQMWLDHVFYFLFGIDDRSIQSTRMRSTTGSRRREGTRRRWRISLTPSSLTGNRFPESAWRGIASRRSIPPTCRRNRAAGLHYGSGKPCPAGRGSLLGGFFGGKKGNTHEAPVSEGHLDTLVRG